MVLQDIENLQELVSPKILEIMLLIYVCVVYVEHALPCHMERSRE